MNDEFDHLTGEQRLGLLRNLEVHPGFCLLCKRLCERRERDIDAKVWDVATPDAEVRILRETRRRLSDEYDLGKMLSGMIATAESEAKKERRR